MGKLQGRATYDERRELVEFKPSGSVRGLARIEGRRVYVTGQDFTIRGGSGEGEAGGVDMGHGHPGPVELRIPTVNLLDGAGGSVTDFPQVTYIPDGHFGDMSTILNIALLRRGARPSLGTCSCLPVPLQRDGEGKSQVFPAGHRS
jgi:hypothetical protein